MSLLGLDKLDNLKYMKGLKELQHLDQMKHMDNLQHMDKLQYMQHMDKLQYMDKLHYMQSMDQLKYLSQLEKMHEMNQLQMLQRLDKLEYLAQNQHLHALAGLDKLEYLTQTQHLHALSDLQYLEVLSPLKILDRLPELNFTTLLYVFSVAVPGLVFQESAVLFTQGQIGLKRAMVLMVIYNVLNLLLGVLFIFPFFSQLQAHPVVYYLAWFAMLVLAPVGVGWLLAMLIKAPRAERFSELLVARPRQVVANAWERFLTEADRYELVITLNNAEKMMGFFQKGSHAPASVDPNDLYFTETAHYDPQATAWTDLEHPVHVWVKGSEIKMVEVTPQEATS